MAFGGHFRPPRASTSALIHKTRNMCCSNVTKKTKENNENCLGSQIKKIEICIGDWLEFNTLCRSSIDNLLITNVSSAVFLSGGWATDQGTAIQLQEGGATRERCVQLRHLNQAKA